MKKMTKTVTLLALSVLMLMCICACGKKDGDSCKYERNIHKEVNGFTEAYRRRT